MTVVLTLSWFWRLLRVSLSEDMVSCDSSTNLELVLEAPESVSV